MFYYLFNYFWGSKVINSEEFLDKLIYSSKDLDLSVKLINYKQALICRNQWADIYKEKFEQTPGEYIPCYLSLYIIALKQAKKSIIREYINLLPMINSSDYETINQLEYMMTEELSVIDKIFKINEDLKNNYDITIIKKLTALM